MKYLHVSLISLSVLMTACGEDGSQSPSTTESIGAPSPTPSPSPSPKADADFLGSWQDTAKNVLLLKEDGSGNSNGQSIHWSLTEEHILSFSVESLVIDTCTYAVLAKGGLQTPLEIRLALSCEKNGSFVYIKDGSPLTAK